MSGTFHPIGQTIPLPLTTISTAIFLSSFGSSDHLGISAVRCYNTSTNEAYLFFQNASTASGGVAQTSMTTGPWPSLNGYPVPYKQMVDYAVGPNTWVSGITPIAGMTALVTVTPGIII